MVKDSDNESFSFQSNFLINCAGLEADTIAEMAGIDLENIDAPPQSRKTPMALFYALIILTRWQSTKMLSSTAITKFPLSWGQPEANGTN